MTITPVETGSRYEQNVACKLEIDEQGRCIRIRIIGRLNASDIDAVLASIAKIRQQHGINGILCDRREMSSAPDLLAIFRAGVEFCDHRYHGMRLAIVKDSRPEDMTFFETVTSNRGGLVRAFDDEMSATQWLRA